MPACITILLIHYIFISKQKTEWAFILVASVLGIIVDTLFLNLDITRFEQHEGCFIPLWLVLLWPVFSTMFYHCLSVFRQHYFLAAILGGTLEPLSYWYVSTLGIVFFPIGFEYAMVLYCVVWSFMMPLLFYISNRVQFLFLD